MQGRKSHESHKPHSGQNRCELSTEIWVSSQEQLETDLWAEKKQGVVDEAIKGIRSHSRWDHSLSLGDNYDLHNSHEK